GSSRSHTGPSRTPACGRGKSAHSRCSGFWTIGRRRLRRPQQHASDVPDTLQDPTGERRQKGLTPSSSCSASQWVFLDELFGRPQRGRNNFASTPSHSQTPQSIGGRYFLALPAEFANSWEFLAHHISNSAAVL